MKFSFLCHTCICCMDHSCCYQIIIYAVVSVICSFASLWILLCGSFFLSFLPEVVHPFFRKQIVYMTIFNSSSTWVATCCLRGMTWHVLFSCVQIMVWLPVLGNFSMCRCWCRQLHPRVPQTPWESLHWKLTLAEKSLAAVGNQTCVSSSLVPTPSQLSYIPPPPPPPHPKYQSLNL